MNEAGLCFGAFFRGADPDSITGQARAAVGGQMFAQLALDLRSIVEGLSQQS